MESTEPVIIAMKGPSGNEKREIASVLAKFLHYPLIDERDIILELKNSPSSSSSSDSLSFKIVTQIAKTQLQLNLQVMISTPLSQDTHIDQLLELTKDAHLVVVECSNEGARYRSIGRAPLLGIDTTKQFIPEDFVPKIQDAILNRYQNVDPEDQQQDDKIIVRRAVFTEAHAHEFCFIDIKHDNLMLSDSDKFHCNFCEEVISGPLYKCTECDEFILHKSCAEFDTNFDNVFKSGPLFYLNRNPSEYKFSLVNKCKLCENYSSSCNSCLLQTHIKCGLVPTIWRSEKHAHPLSFVIMPFWFNYEYQCVGCSKFGKSISYKCYECNFDLHIPCALKESSTQSIVVGPFGDHTQPWDDGAHLAVKTVLIGYWDCVDSVQFEYVVSDGTSMWSDKHGWDYTPMKQITRVELDYPDEYLIEVRGTLGSISFGSYHRDCAVLSLTLQSNKKTHGPFGVISPRATKHFSSSHDLTQGDFSIVGFHGCSGWHLDSIGFHLLPTET